MKKICFVIIILMFIPISCMAEEYSRWDHYNGDHSHCYTVTGMEDGITGNFRIAQGGIDVTDELLSSGTTYYFGSYEASYTLQDFIAWDNNPSIEGRIIEYAELSPKYSTNSHMYLNPNINTFLLYGDSSYTSGSCGEN